MVDRPVEQDKGFQSFLRKRAFAGHEGVHGLVRTREGVVGTSTRRKNPGKENKETSPEMENPMDAVKEQEFEGGHRSWTN